MINLLIEGWFNIPHSYANVVCFEMFAMYKLYSTEINFYIVEKEYFCENWKKTIVLPDHYRNVLFDNSIFKPYKQENIDLIYRVSFPYDISIDNKNINTPKCIFFTSEYGTLTPDYFMYSKGRFNELDKLKKYLQNFRKNLFFTCPSRWSSWGLEKIDPYSTNKIITHGIDSSIFYKDFDGRKKIRDLYSIKDSDTLLMNIGALTSNKGIIFIILALAILVRHNIPNLKLLIKGISDLYQTTNVMQNYFNILSKYVSKEEYDNLINNHIIIIYDTLDFNQLKNLYNACDLYVSPYIAEGFNLTPLEALACGCNVAVSSTGSTEDYINDIYENGGSDFIYKIHSEIEENDSKLSNKIDVNDVIKLIYNFLIHKKNKDPSDMISYIKYKYSWEEVAKLKINYFKNILCSTE